MKNKREIPDFSPRKNPGSRGVPPGIPGSPGPQGTPGDPLGIPGFLRRVADPALFAGEAGAGRPKAGRWGVGFGGVTERRSGSSDREAHGCHRRDDTRRVPQPVWAYSVYKLTKKLYKKTKFKKKQKAISKVRLENRKCRMLVLFCVTATPL